MHRLFLPLVLCVAVVSCARATAGGTGLPQTMPTIRVEGQLTYGERLALPADAIVRVELRDVSRADAPATSLASQTIPTGSGPPYAFALVALRDAVAPRAALTVFAEIRHEGRLLFITDTHNAVPLDGASALEIRLAAVGAMGGGGAAPEAPRE